MTDMQSTPLHFASFYGHNNVVKKLLKAGANIEAKEFEGFTPLLFASQEGRLEIVLKLLRCGADYESITNKGIFVYLYYF